MEDVLNIAIEAGEQRSAQNRLAFHDIGGHAVIPPSASAGTATRW
jgi:hypothetical protein